MGLPAHSTRPIKMKTRKPAQKKKPSKPRSSPKTLLAFDPTKATAGTEAVFKVKGLRHKRFLSVIYSPDSCLISAGQAIKDKREVISQTVLSNEAMSRLCLILTANVRPYLTITPQTLEAARFRPLLNPPIK